MVPLALSVSESLEQQGVSSTVIDPRWVIPVPGSVVSAARDHRIVVVLEDGVKAGGVGSRIRQEMRSHGVDTALNEVGLPSEFIPHASRSEIFDEVAPTTEKITGDIMAQLSGEMVPYARGKGIKPKHAR